MGPGGAGGGIGTAQLQPEKKIDWDFRKGVLASFDALEYRIYKTVSTVEFTWDERKNRANRKKHRVSFETAVLVFEDPFHISVQDREVEGEARWQTIGMAADSQVLLVAHTVDEETETIRILSARKATRRERNIYAQSI